MISRGFKKSLYAIVVLATIFVFTWKPVAIVSQVNESDQDNRHIRKVFRESIIGQTINVPTGYISGIELKISKKNLPNDTPIKLSIKKTPENSDKLIQISTTLTAIRTDERIIFNFKPLVRKKVYFEIEAPTLNEKNYIALRYQIDSEKYPSNQTYINGEPVYGDLAFSVRSSPPVILIIIDYISKHPSVILAMILFCTAIFLSRIKQTNNCPSTKSTPNKSKEWIQIIIIFLFTIISFAPLLNLYFRQDDFVILDRARTLLTDNPLLLFTNRGFVEASRSDIPVHIAFYRPTSNSVIPALLYKLFGTNALPHYFFNFLIHAVSAVGVYYIFRHYINKNIALLATLIWSTHSAVYATVSWLSSIQEVLSAFFLIFSLLTLSLFWNNRQKKYWVISIVLYILAILSKENAFLYLAIAPLFLFSAKREIVSFKEKIRKISYLLTPYLFSSTLVLLIRNWMLNESGLRTAVTDASYKLSTNPQVMIGNMFACFTWAIQSWIIGVVTKNSSVENYLTKIEETMGWIILPPPPILLILFILFVFIVTGFIVQKNNKNWQFPIAFYIISSLPFLLLLNERQARWQYFPLIGLILLFGISMQNFPWLNKFMQKKLFLFVLLMLVAFESQWALKNYPVLIEAKKQSALTKQAMTYLQTHYPSIPKSTEIVIANVPKERKQNLGYAAIPFIYNDSTLITSYPDNPPNEKESNKIYLIYSEENNTLNEMKF